MDKEHVEDRLINKHLVIEDEQWDVAWAAVNASAEEQAALDRPGYGLILGETGQPRVTEVIGKISEVNRYRRNYLCLRDWSLRRPW